MPRHAADLGVLREAETQTAGAAADIQHALRRRYPGEVDEQRREPPAPSAHLQLVAIAIDGDECR